jgi:hypothetical protein
MRLTLHYRGILRSNGSPAHKHEIRQHFHIQLRTVWAQQPLVENPNLLQPKRRDGDYCFLRPVGDFTFVPLVTEETNTIAELSITMLRPETPGGIITQGGDLDNRMKTLFDALTMPRHANALPPGVVPLENEKPYFYCLLEDDNLVTTISVRTEQLLEPVSDQSVVDVSIFVRTRVTRPTMGNGAFA